MRGRLNPFDVDLRQLVDMVENRREFPGEGVELFLAQPQARESCDMQNLFAINHKAEFMDASVGVSGRLISSLWRHFARPPGKG